MAWIAWANLARKVPTLAGFNHTHVHAYSTKELDWVALYFAYSALTSERDVLLSFLKGAIGRYLNECI